MGRRWVDAKKEGEEFRKAGREEREGPDTGSSTCTGLENWTGLGNCK